MVEFLGRGLFEGVYLAALRIDAGHHVLDRAVFAGRIHRLQNQQHRPRIGRKQYLLGFGELRDVIRQERFERAATEFLPKLMSTPGRVEFIESHALAMRHAASLN